MKIVIYLFALFSSVLLSEGLELYMDSGKIDISIFDTQSEGNTEKENSENSENAEEDSKIESYNPTVGTDDYGLIRQQAHHYSPKDHDTIQEIPSPPPD